MVDWVQSVVVFSLGETFKLPLVACSLEQEVLLFIANEKCLSFVVVIDPSIDGLMAVKMGDGRRTSLNSTHWTKKLTDGRRTDATKKQRDENKQRNAKQREKATHTTHITTHLAFDNEDYEYYRLSLVSFGITRRRSSPQDQSSSSSSSCMALGSFASSLDVDGRRCLCLPQTKGRIGCSSLL